MSQMTASARVAVRAPARTPAAARLRVVAAAPARSHGIAFGILCSILLIAGLMVVLVLNTARAEGSFTLQRLQATSSELADTRVTLEAELAHARSPQNLAQEAMRLGMVPSQSTAFIRASDGQIVGVAVEAEPDDSFTVVSSPTPPESLSDDSGTPAVGSQEEPLTAEPAGEGASGGGESTSDQRD